MAKITPKQRRFVAEYLIDLNGTQAAIRVGYSPLSATVHASRLLGNANVQALLKDEMQARSERTGVSQDQVIHELARVAFFDIGQAFEGQRLKTLDEMEPEFRSAVVGYKATTAKTGAEIKMADKIAALTLLGKHLGLFNDPEKAVVPVIINMNADDSAL